MFISPPEPVGLTPGVTYSYSDGFPILDEHLFLDKPKPLMLLTKDRRISQGISSPMTRRSKFEMKQAQKLATQHASIPHLWAKCLLSNVYSLWFIHLPAYLKLVSSKSRTLRVALEALRRMRTVQLQPPDEVCFRVLMQLCGQYNEPVLAIKVLYEMKRQNVQPNAITYGYYNKAVLQSCGVRTTTNAARLLWRKLYHVIIAVGWFKKLPQMRNQDDKISQLSVDSALDNQDSFCQEDQEFIMDLVNISSAPSQERIDIMSDKGYGTLTPESGLALARTASITSVDSQTDNLFMKAWTPVKTRMKSTPVHQPPPPLSREASFSNRFSSINSVVCNGYSKLNQALIDRSPAGILQTELMKRPKPEPKLKHGDRIGAILSNYRIIMKRYLGKPTEGNHTKRLLESPEFSDIEAQMNLIASNWSFCSDRLTPMPTSELNVGVDSSFDDDQKTPTPATLLTELSPVTENDPLGALIEPYSSSDGSLALNTTSNISADDNTSNTLDDDDIMKDFEPFKDEGIRRPNLDQDFDEFSLERYSDASSSPDDEDKMKNPFRDRPISGSLSFTKFRDHQPPAAANPALNLSWNSLQWPRKSSGFMRFASNKFAKAKEMLKQNISTSPKPGAEDGMDRIKIPSRSSTMGQSRDDLRSQTDSISDSKSSDTRAKAEGPTLYAVLAPPSHVEDVVSLKALNLNATSLSLLRCSMEVELCTSTKCGGCGSVLYDEEILAGWANDITNMPTICAFCSEKVVPILQVFIKDYRQLTAHLLSPSQSMESVRKHRGASISSLSTASESAAVGSSFSSQGVPNDNAAEPLTFDDKSPLPTTIPVEYITVHYLSPLVLRKELESLLLTDGDQSLIGSDFVYGHASVFWNLVWYFKRLNLPSYLNSMVFKRKRRSDDTEPSLIEGKNVKITAVWDDPRLMLEFGPPLHMLWTLSESSDYAKALITEPRLIESTHLLDIIKCIQCSDLRSAIMKLISLRSSANYRQRSVYRELLFLAIKAIGRSNLNVVLFDSCYQKAYDSLPNEIKNFLLADSKPPASFTQWTRKVFSTLLV